MLISSTLQIDKPKKKAKSVKIEFLEMKEKGISETAERHPETMALSSSKDIFFLE
jgi:hypothetical protein